MMRDIFTKVTLIIVLAIIAPVCAYLFYTSAVEMRADRTAIFAETETVFEKAQAAISYLNNKYNENMPLKTKFIEANGFFQHAVGKHFIEDVETMYSIVKADNGELYFTGYWQAENVFDQKNLPLLMQEIKALDGALSQAGIPLVYIAAPEKYIVGYTKFPDIIPNYNNDKVDSFLSALSQTDIPYLDLRKVISEPAADKSDLFYYTDHHWQSDSSFDAAWAIGDYLNSKLGFKIDPHNYCSNINNYLRDEYPQSFVGSQGRRVGRYYTRLDDFTLIYPAFATDYVMTYYSGQEKNRSGDFVSALVFDEYIKNSDVYTNRYAAWLGGDHALLTIDNKLQPDYKLLILKDSFTSPAACFLSTAVNEIKLVDLRQYNNSFTDLALAYQPDAVIILYSSSGLNEAMFDFDNNMEESP